MMVFPLRKPLTVVLALIGICCLLAPPNGLTQPPAARTGNLPGRGTAVAGQPSLSSNDLLTDKELFQGKWQILSVAWDGKTHKREDKSPLWKATFHSDLVVQGDRLGHGNNHKGKFVLDETKNPKEITVQDAEGKLTFRGIYALDDSTLKVCMNGNGKDSRRPETFASKHGVPQAVITFKRQPLKP
jgi:uncharacterized protein (TIGR03067 family)